MDLFQIILFLGVVFGVSVHAQQIDPRFIGQYPDHCGDDVSFCMTYCLSIDPGTVRARCAADLRSCVCENMRGQAIAVRFIQERAPQPPTTSTTTTPAPPTTTPVPPPEFDYAPEGPVPVLLECDGSEEANTLCNEFCIQQISATHGLCDRLDQTCRCEGVSPAVVQQAPIPAVFVPRPTPPPPPTPPPQQTQFWTPITYGHPNYNYQNPAPQLAPQQGAWGGYFYPTQQQQQQQQPMQFPMMGLQGQGSVPVAGHWGEPYHTISEQWINLNQPQGPLPQVEEGGQEVRMETSSTQGPISTTPQPETSSEVSVTSTVEEVISESDPNHHNHQLPVRKRRSAGSSYSTLSSFGSHFFGGVGNEEEGCSVKGCEESCASSGLDSSPSGGRRCIPKCVDDACLCLCKPAPTTTPRPSLTNFNAMLDSKVSEMVEQVLAQPVQIVNSKPYYSESEGNTEPKPQPQPHPSSQTMGGLTYGLNKVPMTQDQFLSLFTPPPTLIFD